MIKAVLDKIRPMFPNRFWWYGTIVRVVILVVMAWSGWTVYWSFYLPPRTPLTQTLYQGVRYHRIPLDTPRPIVVHVVEVDLTVPSNRFFVTPPDLHGNENQLRARTTTQFVEESGVQLAVNGSYFYPFEMGVTPWHFYPKLGDPVTPVGLTISDGIPYSQNTQQFKVLCFTSQRAFIMPDHCPDQTQYALSGDAILVENGRSRVNHQTIPYPRTAVGIDQTGQKVWIVVVDGKQWLYSEGVTTQELADFFVTLGVDRAINLDGGGSVTLAINSADGGVRLLNAPIHTHIPLRERPIANNLGLFASPSQKAH